jgi:hypothetical protein
MQCRGLYKAFRLSEKPTSTFVRYFNNEVPPTSSYSPTAFAGIGSLFGNKSMPIELNRKKRNDLTKNEPNELESKCNNRNNKLYR